MVMGKTRGGVDAPGTSTAGRRRRRPPPTETTRRTAVLGLAHDEDDDLDRPPRRHHGGAAAVGVTHRGARACTCTRRRGDRGPDVRVRVRVRVRGEGGGGGDEGGAAVEYGGSEGGPGPESHRRPDRLLGGGGGGGVVVSDGGGGTGGGGGTRAADAPPTAGGRGGVVTVAAGTATPTTAATTTVHWEGDGGQGSSTFVHLDRHHHDGGDDDVAGGRGHGYDGNGHSVPGTTPPVVGGVGDGTQQRIRAPHRRHMQRGGRQLKHRHAGFLDAATHASVLVRAGRGDLSSSSSGGGDGDGEEDGISLCRSCVERVASAVEANAERLMGECRAYEEAVVSAAEANAEDGGTGRRGFLGVDDSGGVDDDGGGSDGDDDTDEMRAVRSYLEEITALTSECDAQLSNLTQLRALVDQQLVRAEDLRRLHEVELIADVTSVDFVAHRSFPDATDVAASTAAAAMDECDAVTGVGLLPILFDVVVPPPPMPMPRPPTPDRPAPGGGGGTHQNPHPHPRALTAPPPPPPTINGLRLLLCRYPTGEGTVGWDEVNAAWSQAAQLLLFAGGAVNFVSPDYRIVPLASPCAKIIEVDRSTGRKIRVHNLGVEKRASARISPRDDDEADNAPPRRRPDDDGDGSSRRHERVVGAPLTDAVRAFRELLGQLVRHLSDGKESWRRPALSSGTYPTGGGTTPVSTTPDNADDDDRGGRSDVVRGIAADLRWVAEFTPSVAD